MALREFRRVLVANRGEIAIRVFRACTELHKETVAIYSAQDSLSLHRYKADESYLIGRGKGPVEAYLDIDGIVDLALRHRVDAVHPGYGFLSENPAFARRCQEAGVTFIGPRPEHLELFGDKLRAKALAHRAGLPVVPGSDGPIDDPDKARAFADRIGYPIIVKAVAGGGGRGMRVVRSPEELRQAMERARSEAEAAFGSGAVYLEKYLERPKHVEVQVLADAHGHMVHLFERDCSIQRRHQKLVEVAPSPSLSEATRQALCDAALRLMREVDYVNAGTVEFLLDEDGSFYFIEVNPRIQVEHTVTELVTGIDIVQAQIRVAEGYRLADPVIGIGSQEDVVRRGFAIQCRVTTEDPRNGFLPDTGRIVAYRTAGGFGVRLDAGNGHAGAVITPYYDSLLVKYSTWGLTLESAAAKMARALRELRIRGVKTNSDFLLNVVQHPQFLAGNCDTTFVDSTPELYVFPERRDRGTKLLGYIAETIVNGAPGMTEAQRARGRPEARTPVPPAVLAGSPPAGARQVLQERGPEGLAEWVRRQERLLVVDTTWRDGHQSLLATRLRSYDMLAVAEATAHLGAGLFGLEVWGGATFDTALRFLRECPWERLERLRQRVPNLLFQMLLRGSNLVGYSAYPDNVVRKFVHEAAAAGVDLFRIFDSLNWVEGLRVACEAALETGRAVEAAICYTGDVTDPSERRYTLDYYCRLALEFERLGVHFLAIKDMAGLLKPRAAEQLVRALKETVRLPIHLHTHDTSGAGLATLLAAAEAGVDIVDAALSPMSGLTSQPSLNTLVAALRGSRRDTGLDPAALQRLADYWDAVRDAYAPFESGLRSPTAAVYQYEIPGGQYSNLRAQAEAMGLGDRWPEVLEAYAAANRALGGIVKVTPASKMVGDLALFMVQNDLDEKTLVERAAELDFPESVVQYCEGWLGQPPFGFPEPLRSRVLKGRRPIEGRPGALLEPVDFEAVRQSLRERLGVTLDDRQVLSYLMFPKEFEAFQAHRARFGDTSSLDTSTFFYGLRPGEQTTVEIEPGKTLIISLTAVGDRDADGGRTLYFELNGQVRQVRVQEAGAQGRAVRPKAEPGNPAHVAASMPGRVMQVLVKVGDSVAKGDPLAVVEAMKMEVTSYAPRDGVVEQVLVAEGDGVEAGDLLVVIAG